MKTKSYYLAAAAFGGLLALSAAPAMAFHGGGVAHCDGCHSMHNSPENPITGNPNQSLMKGSDASSTCLNCHSGTTGYHIQSTDGSNMSEGGDFGWLTNEFKINVRGTDSFYAGDNAGHNIVALDYGLTEDGTYATAPGSTEGYESALLGCTSCHDAHGQKLGGTAGGQTVPVGASGSYSAAAPTGTQKGNFRLLGDSSYAAGHLIDDAHAFNNDAPVALTSGSNGAQTRYGSGMSEWCANCHDAYLNVAPDSDDGKHPTAVPLAKDGYDINYNKYVKTGQFDGVVATAYDDMVPIETGSADQGTLITAGVGSTIGADANSQVMCLSCHRSHASAFNNMGRWDFETDFLSKSAALNSTKINFPATGVAYYANGAPRDVVAFYGTGQRSLCNKCHVQD